MINFISSLVPVLQQRQHRVLLLLGGDESWCYQQLEEIIIRNKGDWIGVDLVSHASFLGRAVSCGKQLLGATFLHGVIDLQKGFNVMHLAMLAGALRGGSLLVMLTPTWATWAKQPDNTVLQWGDSSKARATPNFIHLIQQILMQDITWLGWWQSGEVRYPRFALTKRRVTMQCSIYQDGLTQEQQVIYNQMQKVTAGFFVLTAARGRGKSTLAGKLAHFFDTQRGGCWVTAPQKNSAQLLLAQSDKSIQFFAPDDLLRRLRENSFPSQSASPWLIVEEAASLPLPILQRLTHYFNKILFITTLQGYEGSGQGFLLKFMPLLESVTLFHLDTPIRWEKSDPLEPLVNKLLFLQDDRYISSSVNMPTSASSFSRQDSCWLTPERLVLSKNYLRSFFQLLIQAHYRTTPLDLRRLLDAPYAFLLAKISQQQVIAAAWSLYEGQIPLMLQQAILIGQRRPRGNLVPQTLLAHGQLYSWAALRGVRITRLAVLAQARHGGIATRLITKLIDAATHQQQDYLSACFGYTAELAAFWEQCGFHLIHIGTQRETRSGCYSAIFIYPLSYQAQRLLVRSCRYLQQDWYWLSDIIQQSLPITTMPIQQRLMQRDWLYLIAFALGQRSIYATYPNLMRLTLHSTQLQPEVVRALCIKQYSKLTNRRERHNQLRQQVLLILNQLDSIRTANFTQWLFNSLR